MASPCTSEVPLQAEAAGNRTQSKQGQGLPRSWGCNQGMLWGAEGWDPCQAPCRLGPHLIMRCSPGSYSAMKSCASSPMLQTKLRTQR